MIDLSPTEEQLALRDTVRAFADRELREPVEEIYRRGHDCKPMDFLAPALRTAATLGLLSLLVPDEDGGGGGSCVDMVIALEEIGAVDVAVAASQIGLTATMARLVARHGTPAQRDAWLGPAREGKPFLFSGALSEPDRAGSDLFAPDAAAGPQLSARQDGDGWVLDGRKSAFVTNAGVADAYFVMARTDKGAPPAQGLTMFYVPAGTDGLSFGPRTRLTGWRTGSHAEVLLDGVRVPAEAVVGEVHGAGMVFASCPEVAICLAASYVGLARAALELADGYARERVSWGVPIVQHQAVALKLAESAVDVQAARLMVWDAARAADVDPWAGVAKAPAAKVFAVDAAIRCAQRAVEVLGGYGVTEEYRAARYLNDAWVGWSCDFTRDVLLLGTVTPAP